MLVKLASLTSAYHNSVCRLLDPSQPCSRVVRVGAAGGRALGGWVVLVRRGGGRLQNGKSCPRGNLHTKPPNKVISGESRETRQW